MKTVFVLFDTLVRKALGAYGGTTIPTPGFDRLARQAVTFDNHYVGSLPCMPARRDMMTGRLNFLHRSWGPLEPFDNAFPALMHDAGVYTHLVSDHYHYWEDGGATYHNRYDSAEFVRGQEGDAWKAMVAPPWERLKALYHPIQYNEALGSTHRKNIVNREFIAREEDFPSVQCFALGQEFLARHHDVDNWFLQIETFDPHEPFHAPARFRQAFPSGYRGPILDWPPYARVRELPEECDELRANYAALLCLCDELLGQLLDTFDRLDLWRDTALIVGTDHGFLLGEHDWWAKVRMPCYQEVAHIPLFIHTPAQAAAAGARRTSLTQTIDLMPTILDLYGLSPPAEVMGRSLLPMLGLDAPVREAALYGVFGGATNITDGRFTYFRYPPEGADPTINQYTVMPTHMNARFSVDELSQATLAAPFDFTKGVPLLKVPGAVSPGHLSLHPQFYKDTQTALYDMTTDPLQLHPLDDPATEARLTQAMIGLMAACDAPAEAFTRLGLTAP